MTQLFNYPLNPAPASCLLPSCQVELSSKPPSALPRSSPLLLPSLQVDLGWTRPLCSRTCPTPPLGSAQSGRRPLWRGGRWDCQRPPGRGRSCSRSSSPPPPSSWPPRRRKGMRTCDPFSALAPSAGRQSPSRRAWAGPWGRAAPASGCPGFPAAAAGPREAERWVLLQREPCEAADRSEVHWWLARSSPKVLGRWLDGKGGCVSAEASRSGCSSSPDRSGEESGWPSALQALYSLTALEWTWQGWRWHRWTPLQPPPPPGGSPQHTGRQGFGWSWIYWSGGSWTGGSQFFVQALGCLWVPPPVRPSLPQRPAPGVSLAGQDALRGPAATFGCFQPLYMWRNSLLISDFAFCVISQRFYTISPFTVWPKFNSDGPIGSARSSFGLIWQGFICYRC